MDDLQELLEGNIDERAMLFNKVENYYKKHSWALIPDMEEYALLKARNDRSGLALFYLRKNFVFNAKSRYDTAVLRGENNAWTEFLKRFLPKNI